MQFFFSGNILNARLRLCPPTSSQKHVLNPGRPLLCSKSDLEAPDPPALATALWSPLWALSQLCLCAISQQPSGLVCLVGRVAIAEIMWFERNWEWPPVFPSPAYFSSPISFLDVYLSLFSVTITEYHSLGNL
jgi:hypothetical protein